MQTPQKLKYLFTVTYKDGSVYQQNAEDRSLKEPEKRSCYFDLDQDNIASFVLKGAGHEYGVYLKDGHFTVDGIPFSMSEGHWHVEPNGKRQLIPLGEMKLVFFRQHTHHFKVGETTQKEVGHEIVYRMGWEVQMPCGHTQREIMQFE
jgi:hypothetical protein